MKKLPVLALLLLAPLAVRAADCCAEPQPASASTDAAAPAIKTHPLKGVVMALLPEKTALLVKHEEVPGVMRAMTMMFKVEPAVLTQVKRGDAIKALMSRREDGWWLTEVAVAAAAK